MSRTPDSPHEIAVPVDRARAEALRARLHAELDRQGSTKPTPRTASAVPQELQMSPSPTPRPARRMIAWAAAAVAAVGLAGVVAVAANRDDGKPQSGSVAPPTTPSTSATPTSGPPAAGDAGTTPAPTTTPAPAPTTAPQAVPSTAPPTTTPPTTETAPGPTRPPLPDAEIVAIALPDSTTWGTGWTSARDIHTVEMRGDIAAQVPACAEYLAAFESPERPAVTGYELGWHVPAPPALTPVYVAVFPDEASADAMFDATKDPDFMLRCIPAYNDKLIEVTGQTLVKPGFSISAFGFETPIGIAGLQSTLEDFPSIDVTADEQWTAEITATTWDDRSQLAVIRIGRAVLVVWGGGSTERNLNVSGDPAVMSDEQFVEIVQGIVERVRDGLGLPV